jgi:hypothetical protein
VREAALVVETDCGSPLLLLAYSPLVLEPSTFLRLGRSTCDSVLGDDERFRNEAAEIAPGALEVLRLRALCLGADENASVRVETPARECSKSTLL